jgi:3',5'-cyclic AMP phosphodiesterase CpdA
VTRGIAPVWLALACACFEYSPHAFDLDPSERGLHASAVDGLVSTAPPEPLRFALVGDTQHSFDDAADVVDRLNARSDLAFVVQLGDFTHLGLAPEFRLMNDVFARLRVPYLVVIGNHDYLGVGEDIYAEMFGPPNVAFTLGRTRFVLFDSNSREFGFDGNTPDLAWLAAQLAPDGSFDGAVLMSHCAPFSGDFDASLVERYDALLRVPPSLVSFHAHEHRFIFEEREGTPLYVADAVEGRSYLLATALPGGGFEVERVFF